MSYYMICPSCGKGTIGRYATDDSLCGECSDNSSTTDKLSVEKLQEQLNTAKKALTEIASTRQEIWRGGTLVGLEATEDAKIAFDALAAIGDERSGDE
ncbi:MAG: hypothetical protein L0L90_12400 [Lactococcus lactis]|jgi:ribosomal protein L37AE/L43A|uniref:hypothetical protein n=1 Tax=Lactococcus lactis TaxID=1358 RepID=UPI002654A9BF|nr:hypothetical protein [Lactococcus lactis]MDN6255567.1 hypothetical protein [Tetragenococcus koreensis]MDN5439426.1 hypothetical protein [Lactococcus lactis]MDN5994797.1 hypothetical protein [Lactococcus lactis]MDN6220777.1 hypothetical protein [Lactococcus lactis]